MSELDFSPSPNKIVAEHINALIDDALVIENNKQKPRNYLGGSRLGVECSRALYYEYIHAPKDPGREFPGRIIRRFRMGFWHEDETLEWFRLANFDIRNLKDNGDQFGFSICEGKIEGHIDGVLLSGVKQIGSYQFLYPYLWEHKIMKHSKWMECNRKGVKKSHPVYYGQLQIYMAYMQLPRAMFVAVDTDTSLLLIQIIEYNPEDAQAFSDRGYRVITAMEATDLPRITRDKNDFRCKFCDYPIRCWAETQ